MNLVGQPNQIASKINEAERNSTNAGNNSDYVTTALGLSKHNSYRTEMEGIPVPMDNNEEGRLMLMQQQQKQPQQTAISSLIPAVCSGFFLSGSSPVSSNNNAIMVDDLNRIVTFQPVTLIILHFFGEI